jgi:hypothetical protein
LSGVVIFAGPSIAAAEAEAIAAFDYRPPAAQGDIYRAAVAGAKAIGLIDGYFEGMPAVWHKEILFALASGIHVFGASSMGALRAAELSVHGMQGIGRIFEWYADGTIDADDEVALVHGPAEVGYVTLSVPLVNVRSTLEKAAREGVLDIAGAASLLSAAAAVHFKQRSWPEVVEYAGPAPRTAELFLEWVRGNAVDQKKLDARVMIAAMADLVADWPGPYRADFAFEPTDAWNAGLETFGMPAVSEMDQRVIDEARLRLADFDLLLAIAAAAVAEGEATGTPGKRSRTIDRFRGERGLYDASAFRAWLSANGLSQEELAAGLAGRSAVGRIAERSNGLLMATLLREIKLRGRYAELLRRAEEKEGKLAAMGGSNGHAVFSRPMLEWFYRARLSRPAPDDLEAAARDLAFADVGELREMIAREYLVSGLERTV